MTDEQWEAKKRAEAIEWQRPYLGTPTGIIDPNGREIKVGDKLHVCYHGEDYYCYALYQDLASCAERIRAKRKPYFAYGQLDEFGNTHPFVGEISCIKLGKHLCVVESYVEIV